MFVDRASEFVMMANKCFLSSLWQIPIVSDMYSGNSTDICTDFKNRCKQTSAPASLADRFQLFAGLTAWHCDALHQPRDLPVYAVSFADRAHEHCRHQSMQRMQRKTVSNRRKQIVPSAVGIVSPDTRVTQPSHHFCPPGLHHAHARHRQRKLASWPHSMFLLSAGGGCSDGHEYTQEKLTNTEEAHEYSRGPR